MLDLLKSNFNLSTIFSLWAIFCFVAYGFNWRKIFKWSLFLGILLFLVCSTNYFPKKLVGKLEDQYSTINLKDLDTSKTYYIHVLGGGYDPDPALPATAQLDQKTLGRLVEGVRIAQELPNAILVTSGYSSKNKESQASVARRAAVELGIPSNRIEMLETPATTWEEVLAFKDKFGSEVVPIIATDAAHMPRAMKMVQAAGFKPIAAPTNFRIKNRSENYQGFTLPNVHSIRLMDIWLHEVLGTWKWEMMR